MTEPSFTTIVSNNLEEIRMIAGDEQKFYYHIYNTTGLPLNLTDCTCTVNIFKYGDPSYVFETLSGSSTAVTGEFYVIFAGIGLSGVYQQQPKIIDAHGVVHMPSQGKIVIFPSPL